MPLYFLGISRACDIGRLPGGPVRWIVAEGLAAAVVGPQPSPPQPAEHARSLAAVHRRIDILPMQFGATVTDEATVRILLHARREELASSLDRVEGASEMGLRITLPRLQGPHFGPCDGTRALSPGDYLASRRTHYALHDGLRRQAESAVAGYVEAMGGLFRDWRQLLPAPVGVVRLAFLVDRGRLAAFGDSLESHRRARPTEPCTAFGPWPPYSFV
jgi:hypothetical protein